MNATSRSRSIAASGCACTWASGCPGSRPTSVTRATGYPAGNTPPSPEVTSRSSTLMSELTGRYGSVMTPALPCPTAIVRRPLRRTCTGTACSGSVIKITSEDHGPARSTWPIRPPLAITAWPLNTPDVAPLFTSTRWRSVVISTLRISAGSHFCATSGSAAARARSCAFSACSASRRSVRSSSASFCARSSAFCACSVARVVAISRIQSQAAEGELTASWIG